MNRDHLPPGPAGLELGRKIEAGAPPHRKERRRRGGQKGNQNARKHGFYSAALDPEEICEFWNIISRERVTPEVALIRIKLRSSLQHDPGNPYVIREASHLLGKWYAAKFGLNKTNRSLLKRVIRAILKQYPAALPLPAGKQNDRFRENESNVP